MTGFIRVWSSPPLHIHCPAITFLWYEAIQTKLIWFELIYYCNVLKGLLVLLTVLTLDSFMSRFSYKKLCTLFMFLLLFCNIFAIWEHTDFITKCKFTRYYNRFFSGFQNESVFQTHRLALTKNKISNTYSGSWTSLWSLRALKVLEIQD